MRVLILAAGQSRRFKEEGILEPKPLLKLEWRGTTLSMLEHVMHTVPYEFRDHITVAVAPEFITSRASDSVHVPVGSLYVINSTKGPADTALQAFKFMDPDNTLIMDVDVLNYTNDLYRLTTLHRPAVLVSWSANPAFSYVDNLGICKRISEKQQISEHAIRGAYYIPISARYTFMQMLEEIVAVVQEPYISQALDQMEEDKYAILTTYTPIEWGTPRDVRISGAHIVPTREKLNARNQRYQRP